MYFPIELFRKEPVMTKRASMKLHIEALFLDSQRALASLQAKDLDSLSRKELIQLQKAMAACQTNAEVAFDAIHEELA